MAKAKKKRDEDLEFSNMSDSYVDQPVFKTAFASGIFRIRSLFSGESTRHDEVESSYSTFRNAPTKIDQLANHTLKYLLLFLNGYFIGIILAVVILQY